MVKVYETIHTQCLHILEWKNIIILICFPCQFLIRPFYDVGAAILHLKIQIEGIKISEYINIRFKNNVGFYVHFNFTLCGRCHNLIVSTKVFSIPWGDSYWPTLDMCTANFEKTR